MDPSSRSQLTRRLRWSGHTDRGKVRRNNEDSFLGQQFNAHEVHHLGSIGEALMGANDFVFAVSDGMGGEMAGEFASRITVENITRLLPRSFQQTVEKLEVGFAGVLIELFDQIHRALTFVGGSYEECVGMQATLSICWFTPNRMFFGHIGDTRIYHLLAAGTGLRQLTHDDTHVGWLFRSGQINEREAREHPRRTALQKALGAGNQFVEPQVGSVTYGAGDLFLLCTDGLVEGLYDAQIAELLQAPARASVPHLAQELVRLAVEKSGRDNTTALVVEVL